jgi:hypothetical protein
MARGDLTLFDELSSMLAQGKINLETDTIKVALIDNVVTPTAADATPQWGAGSGVDYDGNEVATTGGYVTGGMTVSGPEVNYAAGVSTIDDDDSNLSLAQNGAGFTDAYWAIIYSDTATNKDAIGFIELTGPVSEQAGPININWNASGIFAIDTSP